MSTLISELKIIFSNLSAEKEIRQLMYI